LEKWGSEVRFREIRFRGEVEKDEVQRGNVERDEVQRGDVKRDEVQR